MAKPPPYPPKPKGPASKAAEYALKNMIPKLGRTKVDPMDYIGKPSPKKAIGPAKPKRQAPKPKGSGSAGIGENLPKPYKRPKKKPTSGSTSARIRNMEKMYSKRKGIREL